MTKEMSIINLSASVIDAGVLRIEIQRVFSEPTICEDAVAIESMWRADLYEVQKGLKAKYLGTVTTGSMTEAPADLLRQLAWMYEAGELRVRDETT